MTFSEPPASLSTICDNRGLSIFEVARAKLEPVRFPFDQLAALETASCWRFADGRHLQLMSMIVDLLVHYPLLQWQHRNCLAVSEVWVWVALTLGCMLS